MLFHTLAFCCQLKFWKLLQWSEWYGATGENRNFEYKEDKATTQILNLNTKTIEINISFITSNDFRRLSPFVFVMPTPKHKYQCLLILVQRSQCPVYIFKNLCVDCFRYKLSSVWSYIFFLNSPDKRPKQNSSKTKRHSRQQEAKSFRRRTAVSQQNFFWRCHSDFALIG